ncbi:DoxX family protein [Simiduia aestuariiviva]|uniref:Putative oxidoreductase n=1 Tax=Simiduia aestuariiviva TaxID=1510459 RepID=A0A839UKZ8_9GAMM|nr:DoxX family protein [Simiduia aestuariiviva]MBB3167441.1 putative oxidoreductase [Simiduia aestuariiviva]
MKQLAQIASPLGRTLLALIFVMSGASKITAYAATQGYMEAFGIPGVLLPLVIGLEIAGGLALAVGWQARWAALGLAGFSVVSGVVFHSDFGNQMQMIMFMKNLSMAGALLFIVANGPGLIALDNRKAA